MEPAADRVDACGICRSEIHSLMSAAFISFGRIVLVDEVITSGKFVECVECGTDVLGMDQASPGEFLERRHAIRLDARTCEYVRIFHQVAGDDAEAPAFEGARHAGSSAEGIDGHTTPDPAGSQRTPDEVEKTCLVSDVSHGREYRPVRVVPSIVSRSMPHYRVTIRWGAPPRYHVEDMQGRDLAGILKELPEVVPEPVLETGDLIEIRVQADPEKRDFTPG